MSTETQTETVTVDPMTSYGYALLVSSSTGVRVVPLPEGESLLIGRSTSCDVILADPSVSRRHARVKLSDGRLTFEDLGSHNATIVSGARLSPGEVVRLAVGAVIELASVLIVVQRMAEASSPTERKSLTGELPAAPDGQRRATDGSKRRRHPFAESAPLPRASDEPVICDPILQHLYAMLDVVAPTNLSVLLLGETGVGKDVFADALHKRSPRGTRPIVKLNCAALPEAMLEGELFGYERGAFTGALQAKPGLLETAHHGTLFLDEVGELSQTAQAKLLRVLETGEVLRLGSVKHRVVDVRILSATNRDPRALIAEGRFRADLFFRLDGITFTIPPLRRRKAEILPLAESFLARFAAKVGRPAATLTRSAAEALEAHGWPGNVRELRHVIDRAAILSGGSSVDVPHLRLTSADGGLAVDAPEPAVDARGASQADTQPPPGPPATLRAQVDDYERARILDALAKNGGNQTKAALALGVSRRTLINKIEAYDIDRPRRKGR